MKKILSILGSTGSIGKSTLNIVDKKKNIFKINYLTANKNFKLICNQIVKYKPKIFIISDKFIFEKVKRKFKNKKILILNTFSTRDIKKSDITVSAIPGIAGLEPTLLAIKKTKKILIANKESIICGWKLIHNCALRFKTKIIPIDSEHFSIYKLIEKENINSIKKIYITASGGPFLNYQRKNFKKIKPKDALKHPKWKMGNKISVDSSTLMNKIFEIAEAEKLFNIKNKKLEILIHPESLVHAIIEFKNGLKKFLYHETSMIIPLANAIFNEKLKIKSFLKSKNKNQIKNLSFKKVDAKKFPLISIKQKINQYPSSSIIINAANEILVEKFLSKKLDFLGISRGIIKILSDSNFRKYAVKNPTNINLIIKIDKWARTTIKKNLQYV